MSNASRHGMERKGITSHFHSPPCTFLPLCIAAAPPVKTMAMRTVAEQGEGHRHSIPRTYVIAAAVRFTGLASVRGNGEILYIGTQKDGMVRASHLLSLHAHRGFRNSRLHP